ncbi:MAG: L-ribulose-5-phosphate 4-epimerase AraD [Kiritimatiellae bacterium]|nr:L-ribulose-5-phosphate 4-epimerase AraD [Kiritimatiellia bacterium]
MLEELKNEVYAANMRLVGAGLVTLTWGNASGFDRSSGLMVIKPSGVDYGAMKPSDMVVVDLSGKTVEGGLRPSSDTPTHLEFYRRFDGVGGAVHTHSPEATAWAQAARAIPCRGTTHADGFCGPVPVTRFLTPEEVEEAYELNTGRAVAELFTGRDPLATPAALVAGHGPFTWGETPAKAVDNAVALEAVAKMARLMELLDRPGGAPPSLPEHVARKHFMRKHGPNAYYGQK